MATRLMGMDGCALRLPDFRFMSAAQGIRWLLRQRNLRKAVGVIAQT